VGAIHQSKTAPGSVTESFASVSSPSSMNLIKCALPNIMNSGKESEQHPKTTPIESSGIEPGRNGASLEPSARSSPVKRESNRPSQATKRQTNKRFRASINQAKALPLRQHVAAENVAQSERVATTTVTLNSAAPPDPNLDIAFGVDDLCVYAGYTDLLQLATDDVIETFFMTTRTEKRKRVAMKLVRELMTTNKRLRFVKAFASIREAPSKEKASKRAPRTVWKCLDAKEAAIETTWLLEKLVRTGVIEVPERPPPALSSSDVQRVQSLSKLHKDDVEKALLLIHVPPFPETTSAPVTHAPDTDVTGLSALKPLSLRHGKRETSTGACCECNENECYADASCSASASLEDSSEDHCSLPIDDVDFVSCLDLLSDTVDGDFLEPSIVSALEDGAAMQPPNTSVS
jgi:hypothetical protein